MKPWQDYVLNKCFNESNYPEIPEKFRYHSNLKRFMTYDELWIDTIKRNGPIACVTLSLLFKPKIIVEFGVNLGWTSLLLSKLNPQAEVYGIDIRNTIFFDREFPIGYATIDIHKCENYTLHIMDSSKFDMENQVDFCFVDGDHEYEGVRKDCERAWKNRNKDGDWIIAFDDYHPSNEGVVKAVDEFVSAVGFKLQKAWSWYWIGTKEADEQMLNNIGG